MTEPRPALDTYWTHSFLTFDSHYAKYNGRSCRIVREILPPEIDEEVVLMLEIELMDGMRLDAFPDELRK